MDQLISILILVGIGFVALLAVGLIISRLYRRSSKEVSFVRTGFGGQRVIMNGGTLVLPVLHDVIPVNMNTLRLEVRRSNDQALITRDRMRVDVLAEFYVRVQPTIESIANAAQTLGQRTMKPEALRELVEGKFVDALRAVAAEMAMEELHEHGVGREHHVAEPRPDNREREKRSLHEQRPQHEVRADLEELPDPLSGADPAPPIGPPRA